MHDYTIHYRRSLSLQQLDREEWKTVVSAYNGSERVKRVFSAIRATNRHWIIHKEYGFSTSEWPTDGSVFAPAAETEAQFIANYLESAEDELRAGTLCVDITGFMRPHLMLLIRRLKDMGIVAFDVLYTDPVRYMKSENTTFTDGPVEEVRQVAGFEGAHIPDSGSRDLLIIGAGYDDRLVQQVAENKRHARKLLMYGLPSLQPDMYQESRLRIVRAGESIGPLPEVDLLFAPANNPFVTAQALSEAVTREKNSSRGVTNIYLSPLGTKPQVLGFALYYLAECEGEAASILFPYASRYSRETTQGISRISIYSIVLS